MEAGVLLIVSVLLLAAIAGLVSVCWILVRALSSTEDRKILASAVKSMSDVIVLDKEDQIHRIRTQEEAQLGLAHIRAQTVAQTNGRFTPPSDNGKEHRDSVHVDLEE